MQRPQSKAIKSTFLWATKLNYKLFAAFCCLAIGSMPSIASEQFYDCVVDKVYNLTESGELSISVFQQDFEGEEFTVSRQTSDISGKVIPTTFANSTKVINNGSSENSFKATADFDNQVQLIEIQEFRPANQKPFIASSMGGAGLVVGTCA